MRNEKIAILPKLYDANGDLSKQWFVIFSYRNPASNKMERFRIRRGLMAATDEQRRKNAKAIITDINQKLKNGWNPFFDDVKVVYRDTLMHPEIAKKHGDLRRSNKTWRYYINMFLNDKEKRIRKGSMMTYKSKFKIFVDWLIENKIEHNDVTAFDEKSVKKWYNYLIETRHLSQRALTSYSLLFSALGKWMLESKHLTMHPFGKMPRYKRISRIPKVIPDAAILEYKKYCMEHDPQLWVCILFIFYTFIRPHELRYLKIKHIDFSAGKITVPGEISKNHYTAAVTMSETFQNYLQEKGYADADPEHFIFTINGKPGERGIGKNFFQVRWAKAVKATGHSYTLYLFKHTGNLKLLASGIDVVDLKLQNRHQSLEHTWIYLRALENKTNEHIRKNASVI